MMQPAATDTLGHVNLSLHHHRHARVSPCALRIMTRRWRARVTACKYDDGRFGALAPGVLVVEPHWAMSVQACSMFRLIGILLR